MYSVNKKHTVERVILDLNDLKKLGLDADHIYEVNVTDDHKGIRIEVWKNV